MLICSSGSSQRTKRLGGSERTECFLFYIYLYIFFNYIHKNAIDWISKTLSSVRSFPTLSLSESLHDAAMAYEYQQIITKPISVVQRWWLAQRHVQALWYIWSPHYVRLVWADSTGSLGQDAHLKACAEKTHPHPRVATTPPSHMSHSPLLPQPGWAPGRASHSTELHPGI